jgi:hypothetical protein
MNDYSPEILSRKWKGRMQTLLEDVRGLWETARPRKGLLSFGVPEADAKDDEVTPASAKKALLYHGRIVWGLISRAFFPAYIPGKNTHYGSVVYALDAHEPDSIFELACSVNELRADHAPPPPGTERVAEAIRDDRSSFTRILLPVEVGAHGTSYFANLCLHRTRLPLGYIHDRLLPLLVAPEETEWCCILPLRGWPQSLKGIWSSEAPVYSPRAFDGMLRAYSIEP